MRYLRSFARFWWDFVVGDDWLVAAGLALALGLTSLLTHTGVDAWWLLPLAVAFLLAVSLWRATRWPARRTESRHTATPPGVPSDVP